MTLDHFGKPISSFLYQCFGFFSAAEGFFFLSGFVGIFAAISKAKKDPNASWMRLRALRIWKYHILSLMSLICMGIFLFPGLTTFFKSIISHPFLGSFLSLALIHTPAWLDVLPLYVFLMLIGSYFFPLMARGRIFPVWFLSFSLWLIAQLGLRQSVHDLFPNWVYHGFFDLAAWQFIYFSGAAIGAWWKKHKLAETVPHNSVRLISIVAIAITLFLFLWSREWIPLPPPSAFWIDREHLGPLRYLNFIVFALSICFIVRTRPGLLDFQLTATLGKRSLEVYTAHTMLIYLWFITPASIQFQTPWNVALPLFACVLLWLLATVLEKRFSRRHARL